MQKLRQTMRRLWEAACRDESVRPSVRIRDGYFEMEVAGPATHVADLCRAAGAPGNAELVHENDRLTVRWPSHADAIFGPGGLLAQKLTGYEMRLPQLHMARLVQRAVEMRQPAVIEAGTGTGKSFAYAAVCMAMGKRVLISTSNKNLQMQLYRKDIPFLAELFPGKSVALAVGKSNYACRYKAEDQMTGNYAIADADLLDWYLNTESGNTEEIEFAADWRELARITVDDECAGKHCPRYAECFYYAARERQLVADVVITNHALLCLHQLYPAANILPDADVIVVDEAHKLADYARNALGVEFYDTSAGRVLDRAEEFEAATDAARRTAQAFSASLWAMIPDEERGRTQVGIPQAHELAEGMGLAECLVDVADDLWDDDEFPSTPEDRRMAKAAQAVRSLADSVWRMANAAPDGYVRWLEPDSDSGRIKLRYAPHDVSDFVAALAGVERQTQAQEPPDYTRCTRCNRRLTAATVHVLDGHPYGPDCIQRVDPFGDAEILPLAQWLAEEHPAAAPPRQPERATIFTSATLAAPDMGHFLRTAGLPDALQMQAESPFDYAANALLYVPNGSAPAPNEAAWREWAVDELLALTLSSGGGAFLLFTSYNMMRYAAERLRPVFERRGWPVLVQGELPKLETARRFAADGNAVLFATKSFFEGVSIEGAALRLVAVDKMPFEAPSPLGTAMEEALRRYAREELGMDARRAEWYPFEALRAPRMILELKQATGRLIRTRRDYGVMAVLDSRLRSAAYGRRMALPALPPAPLTHSLDAVATFFEERRNGKAQALAALPPVQMAGEIITTAT